MTTATKDLRAFHGDAVIKAKYLARIAGHAEADEIVKGLYWEHGKGCAVGCTVHSGDHAAYEAELGLPVWLARLEDAMFERLPNGEAKAFPLRFLTAIPVGADVSGVRDQFLAWLMDNPTYGTAHIATDPEVKALAAEVGRRLRNGEGVTGPQADELTKKLRAARAAWDAWDARDAWAARAARAAWDARDAWAARAAWDAWDARDAWAARAAWDAWDARDAWAARAARAAWDAWDARDAWAARDAFVVASATELLRLLEAAPVPVAV
jgi:hypothetical protein